MNEDDRLQHYFSSRTTEVSVPAASLATITERGRRRRHRRTAAKLGAVVGVLAIGGAAIAQRSGGGHEAQVVGLGTSVVPSGLDWTVVTPERGIGWSDGSAATADGSIYNLSTAPGSPSPDALPEKALYRSGDGAEWRSAPLPDHLAASGIAAAGDRLYAVGTSPAGGGSEQVEVASTTDGGSAWERTTLPLDLAALGQGFPGTVGAGPPHIATRDGQTVVVVRVRGQIDDVEALLPAGTDLAGGWAATADGIDVYADPCSGRSGSDGDADPGTATTTAAVDPRKGDAAARAGVGCEQPAGGLAVARSFSWSELGTSPAAGAIAAGRTLVFAQDDAGRFTKVSETATEADALDVVAAPDGFWLVSQQYDARGGGSATAQRSPDGRDWTAAPVELPGTPVAAGAFGGHATVVLQDDDGTGGQLATLDGAAARTTALAEVLGEDLAGARVDAAAFGPLGFAAVLSTRPDQPGSPAVVVHSADGTAFSRVAVPGAQPGRREAVNGVSVTADAITVRLNSYPDDDQGGGDASRPRQRLFVGTERG